VQSHPKSDPTPAAAEAESRWGGPRTVLALVLVGAAVLRLVGIRYGLPYGNLLNPDESASVPRAWGMAHGDGIDPDPFFDYPSLLLYLLAPFQAWHEAPSYLTARIVVVVVGLVGVAAAWWLGEKSYGVVAGGVAAVVTAVAGVHVAYSRMAVPDILLTTLITIALALLVSGRIELAGAVAGLAVAAKWPGALVFAPILVVAWGQWRRVAYAAGFGLLAFVLAAPFAVIHFGEALGDFGRVFSHARRGSLGYEDDSFAAIAFVEPLWDSLGPVLIVALVGLVVAAVLRGRADRALLAFVGLYYLALLPLESHVDRYVLPLVPVLAVLAGRFRSFAPVTLLLLVVSFTWTVRDTEKLTKPDTRVETLPRVERTVRAAALRGASSALTIDPGLPRPRIDAVVRVGLPAPWAEFDRRRRLDVPGFVWVNGSIVDRVRAAPDEYPEEAAYYNGLAREAQLLFRVDPVESTSGPWVALFQLPSAG
jgi:4-amino-4-deoxy-L-arabinose transferase-like glycosyltransferase